MKKVLASIGIGILIAVLLVIGLREKKDDFPVGIFEPRAVTDSDPSFMVCLTETGGIDADTAYLLIDLSDTTYWPHSDTATVLLKGYHLQGSVTDNHEWRLNLGAVTENDATDGTAEFVAQKILLNITGTFESSYQWANPLDMWVEDDSLLYISTSMTETATTWQNDAAITATVGVTQFVAAGDIVLLVNEITSGAVVDFGICVEYDTR